MSEVIIDIDKDNERFLLSGNIEELLNKPRIRRYIKDYLDSDCSNPNIIYINFNHKTQDETIRKIRKMLKKYNIDEIVTKNVELILQSFFEDERNFEEFSNKAYLIRNNNCNIDDFNNFINNLENYLPCRRLYELQLLSAYHLAFARNACNFSVPGAGKTSIVYAAYTYLKNFCNNLNKLLVIGPLSSFGPWENEFIECFGYNPNVKRLSGNITAKEKKTYLTSLNTCEITLISYQGVTNIINELIFFLRQNNVMVILDEAHKIKNTEGGIIAQSILKLSKFCKSRVVLTGTPAPNGYEDLYNIFNFIWPDKNIIKFHLYHLKSMSDNPHDSRISTLIDNISPFFIRIKKKDLGIPNAVNHPAINVQMGEAQRIIYDFIEKKYIDYFISENKLNNDFKSHLIKARLIRLMQVATNPSLLKRPLDKYFEMEGLTDNTFIDDSDIIQKIINYKKLEIPSKFIKVTDLVKSIINNGEKVIVWTTFVQNIKDLAKHLRTNNIESKYLYGEVPVDNDEKDSSFETRESIIREFHQDDSEFKVIIANPFAVSESISLHKVCHNAIYLERTFNAAHFIQSKDRIHRYGLKQNDIINYYYILSDNSIDETIHERLDFKVSRMNEIIEERPIPLFNNVLNSEYGDDDIKVLIKNYVNRNKSL